MASMIVRLKNISLSTWTVLAACAVTVLLSLQTLDGRSFSYDEGVYWQSLRAMADGHLLFSSIFSSQPPLFLLSVYPFYAAFGENIAAARLALLVFSVAGIVGTYIAGRALGSAAIGAVACLLLALDPLYERAAHSLQAQLPSISLQVWAVACAALSMQGGTRRRYWFALAAGIFLACASMMKLFAVAALVPVTLFLCAPFFQWYRSNHRQPLRLHVRAALQTAMPPLLLAGAGFFATVIVLILPFIDRLDDLYDQVVRFHLVPGELHDRPTSTVAWKIAFRLGTAPLVYLAFISVLVIAWQRMWVAVPLILWALAGFVVFLNVQPLFNHHIVLFSPALALISGCGAVVAWRAFQASGNRLGLTTTLAILVAAGVAGLSINATQNRTASRPPSWIELKMAKALQAATSSNDSVITDDQYVAALANRNVPPFLVDTSNVRIKTGYLTETQLKTSVRENRVSAILFATGRFSRLPGFRAFVEDRYALAERFGKGRALFLPKDETSRPP